MHLNYRKLLLVNPGKNVVFSTNEPLNLALLASFMESQGVEVQIADQLAGEDIIGKANRFCPDVVGLTATTPVIEDAYSVADYFQQKGIPTVIGGTHATTRTEEAIGKVDMVVRGEGEYPLLDICSDGCDKGIFSSDKIVDISAMPPPARHLLNNEYYLGARQRFPQDGLFLFMPQKAKFLSVLISRGCPWQCAFCHNMWRGQPFRIYKPGRVVAELEHLKKNYGLKYFIFRDDNIFSFKKRIKEILTAMIDADLNMKWSANARADCLNDEILELSRKAGCVKLNFGFESGSQRMLDALNKSVKLETVYESVRKCKEHGIQASGSFIVGHPDEERSDIAQTRKMIRKLKLDSLGVAIATPLPGTRWWTIAEERNLIPEQLRWVKFDFDHVPIKLNSQFSVGELKKIQRTYFFDGFVANPMYLLKIFSAIVSNPIILWKRIKSVLGRG